MNLLELNKTDLWHLTCCKIERNCLEAINEFGDSSSKFASLLGLIKVLLEMALFE